MAQQAQTPTKTRFPCPQCGAVLAYLPGTDRIRCEHCGHESAIQPQSGRIDEHDFRAALAKVAAEAPVVEARTVKCDGCAASFTFDPDVHADACPYCGGAIVTDTGSSRLIKPESLVPFVLSEGEAKQRLQDWLKSLWFAPSGIKTYARGDGRLSGVYVPYWTFDADTQSSYVGQRGIAYQVPQTFMAKVQGKLVRRRRYVTKIRWTPVRGRVRRQFDDVLVLASRTLPQDLTESLTPWLQEALVPYQPEYLSGFRSEAYQVGIEPGFDVATQDMAQVIRTDVARDIGGDTQRIHDIQTRYDDIHFKHILLPVWVAAYRYSGKAYQFVVNGQTGEVQGERPYSIIKIAIAAFIGAAIAALLVFFLQQADGQYTSF